MLSIDLEFDYVVMSHKTLWHTMHQLKNTYFVH